MSFIVFVFQLSFCFSLCLLCWSGKWTIKDLFCSVVSYSILYSVFTRNWIFNNGCMKGFSNQICIYSQFKVWKCMLYALYLMKYWIRVPASFLVLFRHCSQAHDPWPLLCDAVSSFGLGFTLCWLCLLSRVLAVSDAYDVIHFQQTSHGVESSSGFDSLWLGNSWQCCGSEQPFTSK